jgi:hypothetical protein
MALQSPAQSLSRTERGAFATPCDTKISSTRCTMVFVVGEGDRAVFV